MCDGPGSPDPIRAAADRMQMAGYGWQDAEGPLAQLTQSMANLLEDEAQPSAQTLFDSAPTEAGASVLRMPSIGLPDHSPRDD
jgi:hypothetical protein